MKISQRLITLVSLLLCSYTSFSQVDTLRIEEILIFGDPLTKTIQQKIIRSELVNNKAHDVGDLFENIAGFGIIKRGNFAMEPVLRSFKYEQLNIQYDGALKVYNACPNRMDPVTVHVSPKEVEQIEIIKGPYSVRYGPTMGGIINIVLQKPESKEGNLFTGRFESSYETNGNNFSNRFGAGIIKENYDLILNGGVKNYGNYESGDGQEIASSFKTYDFSVKLGLQPVTNQRLQIGFRQNYARDILHAGLPMDADEDNSSLINFDYSIKNLTSSIFRMDIKLYGSMVDHIMSNTLRPSFAFSEAVSTVESQSMGGKFELGISPSEGTIIYTGLDFSKLYKDGIRERTIHYNSCTSVAFDPPVQKIDLIWQDSRLSNYGLFGEIKQKINERFSFNSGVRLDFSNSDILKPEQDFAELYNSNIDPEDEKRISLTTSVNYLYSDEILIQFAVGRGIRQASLVERYINHFSIGMDAFEYVGNPNLVSEKNNQGDLSIQYNKNGLSINTTIFYSFIQDYITAAVDSGISRKFLPCNEPAYAKRFQNVDEVSQTGFEINGEYRIKEYLSVFSNAGYTYARNISWDEPLAEIPPFVTHFGVRYNAKNILGEINMKYSHNQDRVSSSFNESTTDNYKVINLKFRYLFLDYFEFNFAILNILNENYYDHLSRPYKNMDSQSMYFEPGRNFIFGIRAEI